jgi:hypothetical protein
MPTSITETFPELLTGDDLNDILGPVYSELKQDIADATVNEKIDHISDDYNVVLTYDDRIEWNPHDVPVYAKDGDIVAFLKDQLHDGNATRYELSDIGNVPNIIFVDEFDKDTYPSTIAVQEYVSTKFDKLPTVITTIDDSIDTDDGAIPTKRAIIDYVKSLLPPV